MFPVQDDTLKITYITGLGFKEGEDVKIAREEDYLVFKGKVEKEWEETIADNVRIPRRGIVEEGVKIAIRDIEGIEILDESGRSLGRMAVWSIGGSLLLGPVGLFGGALAGLRKSFKSFIIIQAKSGDKLAYQIVLGGQNQKEARKKYDNLIELIRK